MAFDFDRPQFPTAELLQCMPGGGLTDEAFKQWRNRGIVSLSSCETSGRGRPALHSGADVIQVAAIRELTRQGILAHGASSVWKVIRESLANRISRQPGSSGDL